MIDFTSSLYLGMKHPTHELTCWSNLTAGVPAALFESVQSKQISQKIAQMQGLEKGIIAPSTLHLYWDLYGLLSDHKITIFIDKDVYPISKHGIERLQVKGVAIYSFRHFDVNHLLKLVTKKLHAGTVPVIITDGWCPTCGRPAPISDYLEIATPLGGIIIIDDTQAFGILGERRNDRIYGNGGGGILKWLNISNSCIITITSLAKGFGVPMAVICGNKTFISEFEEKSETRVNFSPVSTAHLHAGINALSTNSMVGDQKRRKLLANVFLLKKDMNELGIQLTGGIFPVQSIANINPTRGTELFEKLQVAGIKTVLGSGHDGLRLALCFLINCNLTKEEFEVLVSSIRKSRLFPVSRQVLSVKNMA